MLEPPWFTANISKPGVAYQCRSGAAQISYRCWNAAETHKPGLLFVHGLFAHSRWWDFIAPAFLEGFRVYAMDLSGMGESGHRSQYRHDDFSGDIAAVIKHARIAPAILIGHSFGGTQVLRASAQTPELVAHAILIDTVLQVAAEHIAHMRVRNNLAPPVPLAMEDLLPRFRLMPDQPTEPYLQDYIRAHSICAAGDGWRWKWDPGLYALPVEKDATLMLRDLKVPLDYVCGELSALVSRSQARSLESHLPRPLCRGPFVLPATHHHVMLDQPLLLIATLQALLQRDRNPVA
jgi:pimeloyl-ACP methyl ester carboxylesterase